MTEDFRDILFEFTEAKVEFMVVGAMAMAGHRLPRATGDLDLWIRATPENAVRVMTALRIFGAPIDHFDESDFVTAGMIAQIGVAPNRIDIITTIDGVTFDEAWPERLHAEVYGVDAPVISIRHLILNKKSADRLKDRADVAKLEKLLKSF